MTISKHFRCSFGHIISTVGMMVVLVAGNCCTKSQDITPASADAVQRAVEKGLFYVEENAIRWWKTKKCVSCHDGPALMFSHNIARRQGFAVPLEKLEFWTDRWILTGGLANKRKDGRMDAGGMLGAPLTMLFRDPASDVDEKRAERFGELMQIAGKDWQQDNGSWDIKVKLDYQPWIALALESFEQSEMKLSDDVRAEVEDRRQRTEVWMRNSDQQFPENTEDLAAWLVYENRRDRRARVESLLTELRKRRRDDGLWGINMKADSGHLLVTGAVLFALTSAGLDTTNPLVVDVQRLLLDRQEDDGRWIEGGRIFDDGSDKDNVVYNTWTTAVVCAGLSRTVTLPTETKPLFVPDAKRRAAVDSMTREAAEAYKGGDYGDADEDPT